MSTSDTPEQAALRERVRAGYAAAALRLTTADQASCCGTTAGSSHAAVESPRGTSAESRGDALAEGEGGATADQIGSGCCGASSSVDATSVGSATTSDGWCGEAAVDERFGAGLYSAEDRAELPSEALLAGLGCGNPLAVAELRPGETVLDLGSGGGLDVLLSAKRVGPTGKAYGLDMTEEMLALAEENKAKAGVTNVEFLRGEIEDIPLPDASVDVVISNCVINLSVDKQAVFAEAFRVLRPGGRLGVTDVVAEDHLTPSERAERGPYVGCIAGALSIGEYREGLAAAGFTDIAIEPTHAVADGMHSARIRAAKP